MTHLKNTYKLIIARATLRGWRPGSKWREQRRTWTEGGQGHSQARLPGGGGLGESPAAPGPDSEPFPCNKTVTPRPAQLPPRGVPLASVTQVVLHPVNSMQATAQLLSTKLQLATLLSLRALSQPRGPRLWASAWLLTRLLPFLSLTIKHQARPQPPAKPRVPGLLELGFTQPLQGWGRSTQEGPWRSPSLCYLWRPRHQGW